MSKLVLLQRLPFRASCSMILFNWFILIELCYPNFIRQEVSISANFVLIVYVHTGFAIGIGVCIQARKRDENESIIN